MAGFNDQSQESERFDQIRSDSSDSIVVEAIISFKKYSHCERIELS